MTNRHATTPCPGFVTDLVLRCAWGDEAALGRLVDLFAALVRAEVGRGADPRDTEALAVAAFHRVWFESPTYDPRSQDVVTWVLDQARVVCDRSPTPAVP